MPILANLILPFFFGPYFDAMAHPWLAALAIASEVLVFYIFQRGMASFGTVLLAVVVANAISTAAGAFLLGLIPYYPEQVSTFENAGAFALACFLSIVLEYLVLLVVPRWRSFRKLLPCVIVANTTSYAILAIGLVITW